MLATKQILALTLAVLVVGCLAEQVRFHGKQRGSETLFPGPWDTYNKAPYGRIIRPVRVYNSEGAVGNAEGLGIWNSSTIRPGGLVTFEFKENIAGRVFWTVDKRSKTAKPEHYNISFGMTESPNFIGRFCDATGDELTYDTSLALQIETGNCSFPEIYVRGAFKYLTVYIDSNPSMHNPELEPEVIITDIWVEYTAMPHWPNPQAYTGYFYSSDNLLNRIWYAGAYTLQLTTIDPRQGGSLLDVNRNVDHNQFPPGAWASNYTISNGSSVTTDGAKRDRMVYAGDMTIAVPGIAVSTYDLVSIRNALGTLFDHQYSRYELPYAGPPMGFQNEFSDTYHMHALLGVYNYVQYSGDVSWLARIWTQYQGALEYSLRKVDRHQGLMRVTAGADWLRPGQGGYNIEANAILYETIKRSIDLAAILGDGFTRMIDVDKWNRIMSTIEANLEILWDEKEQLYMDNPQDRKDTFPQDGNSWAVLAGLTNATRSTVISNKLKGRWGKYGAPAEEMPDVISPFATGFELQAHCQAGEYQTSVDLMRSMWGYMLDGKGMTNSTFIEGYATDGGINYPAYDSPARTSHAHGWSTGPTFILSTKILGIQLLKPTGLRWRIEPHFVDLDWAEGGYATELGKFVVRWKKGGKLQVQVPEGSEGDVVWQGTTRKITGGGVWTVDSDGLRRVVSDAQYQSRLGNVNYEAYKPKQDGLLTPSDQAILQRKGPRDDT